MENVLHSLFWCNNMGPINTVSFPVFFWANVKFLFTVTVNKIISLNTLKDGSTLKTQNSEGYVQKCCNSSSCWSYASTIIKSGCMQHSRINVSWGEFSCSQYALSSNIQRLSSFITGFSVLPTFSLEIDRLPLHISWGLRGIWTTLLTCETSPNERYTSSKTHFGRWLLSPDNLILSMVLGKVLRCGTFLLILPWGFKHLTSCSASLNKYYNNTTGLFSTTWSTSTNNVTR